MPDCLPNAFGTLKRPPEPFGHLEIELAGIHIAIPEELFSAYLRLDRQTIFKNRIDSSLEGFESILE